MKKGCEDLPNSLTSIIYLSSSHDTEVFSNFSLFGLSLKRKSEILSFSFFPIRKNIQKTWLVCSTSFLLMKTSWIAFVTSSCFLVSFFSLRWKILTSSGSFDNLVCYINCIVQCFFTCSCLKEPVKIIPRQTYSTLGIELLSNRNLYTIQNQTKNFSYIWWG